MFNPEDMLRGLREQMFPKVSKKETKNEATYGFDWANGAGIEIHLGKATPISPFVKPILDMLVQKEPEETKPPETL